MELGTVAFAAERPLPSDGIVLGDVDGAWRGPTLVDLDDKRLRLKLATSATT